MKSPRVSGLRMVLAMVMLTASICGAAAQENSQAKSQGGTEPVWPTRGWQTSSPEEQGMDSADLAKLVAYGTGRSFDSLLIARRGKIVLDTYYAPYSAEIPHIINSSTKAVIGTLAAMAMKDGLLDSTDHPMLDFFADRSLANVDDRRQAITVQHLLDMTSGIDWREPTDGRPVTFFEMERSRDWTRFILDRPMSNTPGDIFNYNSGNPQLLSAILTKLTGMSAEDYAKAKLFGPLGITNWKWRKDPQGISTGGNGLALLPRDMAKIGYLYLRNGQWEGKTLVPPAFVERSSRATINMNLKFEPAFRYSNYFWALPNRNVYMAVGYHCQVIMVFPALDIVAVTTTRDFYPFGVVTDYIAGAVKSDTALPPSPEGATLLASAVREVSTEKPSDVGVAPETAAAISGKVYTFPGNGLGLKSLSLTLTGSQPRIDVEFFDRDPTAPSRKVGGPIGLDGRYQKGDTTPAGVSAAKGSWSNDHTFVLNRMILGAGFSEQKYTLSFDDEKLNVRGLDWNGREVSVDGGSWRKS
ncbi:CubicO group peptidase, beta-lactamase class C family [Bradyrhizobium lablabi]|jgi:CubicO group peptidase (beta-lactamase class C family)|uniref:CubicO group peptidase, beta-lactamase class C family n=3 Tax=Nitrobacteraceae TaxID=41294 RepID=A0ABY0QEJ3_9BRAD|nr:CubicO group peptidase, beta-lactamase class C family [Bradyrhizobium ottawaense]SEB83276.1 CubicO group peptidase, beta-lactamase class C family [Bradyrhizobium lablabi]